ncbi:FAD binding domain-containing protein [Halogranum gelatinilyticum]|uniref:FAD binding domain-containing protein n=1 Tax=Halogranum gelatinilyticum TaxID=660521 RepID=A0A1G9R0D6_9EURY|nr:FAD-binding protein [Halogranum gelatinilyticum]SDM15925.1 FAD binding domain-containing protein [Halogranum gelatinilyticum]
MTDDDDTTTEASTESSDEPASERHATGRYDVLVVGGGVAGLTASVFTARAGLSTVVVNDGEPIVRRNAHLENFPGFPAGVNSNLFTDMLGAQSTRNGADHVEGRVTEIRRASGDDGEGDREGDERAGDDSGASRFVADVEDVGEVAAQYVVASSWADADYLDGLGVEIRDAGSKRYVDDDGLGRTTVEGVYVAGRLSERYHQAIVAAGHGAEVAITLIHDSEVPYYHDWVAPEGYFTDRGREVPPGCEEIDETERRARERESMAVMQEYFSEPHPERQRTHPSLVDDELGRLADDE